MHVDGGKHVLRHAEARRKDNASTDSPVESAKRLRVGIQAFDGDRAHERAPIERARLPRKYYISFLHLSIFRFCDIISVPSRRSLLERGEESPNMGYIERCVQQGSG